MKATATAIPDVLVIEPDVFSDDRGFFFEVWNAKTFADVGLELDFVQDNHSLSRRGTLRGLHYQLKEAQGKLVRAMEGEIFDVAVDLRRSSPTFGKWVGEWLSGDNHRMLWIPPGFAHGFYVASESAHFLYKCTTYYAREHERAIAWNDPDLGIEWPIAEGTELSLSQKDRSGTPFRSAECFD
jgi:dTDP-4-dehydrorhamnose 3,5-epimerase